MVFQKRIAPKIKTKDELEMELQQIRTKISETETPIPIQVPQEQQEQPEETVTITKQELIALQLNNPAVANNEILSQLENINQSLKGQIELQQDLIELMQKLIDIAKEESTI